MAASELPGEVEVGELGQRGERFQNSFGALVAESQLEIIPVAAERLELVPSFIVLLHGEGELLERRAGGERGCEYGCVVGVDPLARKREGGERRQV